MLFGVVVCFLPFFVRTLNEQYFEPFGQTGLARLIWNALRRPFSSPL